MRPYNVPKTKTAMTKDKFNWKFCLCCGLFIWFVINLLQGLFTEIQEDEAYYALYGEHLAWGYFDHPPMVGLMTFLSSIIFSGTLGVRFFTIIASCLSLFVIWEIAIGRPFDKTKVVEPVETPSFLERPFDKTKVVEPVEMQSIRRSQTPSFSERPFDASTLLSNLKLRDLNPNSIFLFFIIAFSIVMFNIYGFVTTPDVSLILFSALFLLVYQRYLSDNSWKNALLLGILMACLVYSKYHAFLLLGLIVLSNLKLLKDSKFYVACLLAIALLTPHILWQINADFPSFKYHLSQRSEPFRWNYFFEYLPNQLLIFNPLTFGAVVYVLFKHKTVSVFERGLRFILIGFFFFFWLMAFRGHVEPHWTIVCTIPIIVLLYRRSLADVKLKNYIKHFVLPSLLLVLVFRIALLTPLASRFGFSGKEAYYKAVEKVAGDHPVVFRGSFQQPALYHYFTGKESSTLRAYYDRKTQFDLWQFDTAWVGKPVFICGHVLDLSTTVEIDGQSIEGYLMQRFQTPNRLVTDFKVTNIENAEKPVLHRGDTLKIDFSIYNPLREPFDFQHDEMGIRILALYLVSNNWCSCQFDPAIRILPHSTYHGHLSTIVGRKLPTGKNRIALGLGDGISSFTTEGKHWDVWIDDSSD